MNEEGTDHEERRHSGREALGWKKTSIPMFRVGRTDFHGVALRGMKLLVDKRERERRYPKHYVLGGELCPKRT